MTQARCRRGCSSGSTRPNAMKNSNLLEPFPESAAKPGDAVSSGSGRQVESSATPGKTTAEREREPASMIDTSKMSHAQRDALELTEAARTVTSYRSFAGDLFMGRFALDHVYPFPLQAAGDIEAGQAFLTELNQI